MPSRQRARELLAKAMGQTYVLEALREARKIDRVGRRIFGDAQWFAETRIINLVRKRHSIMRVARANVVCIVSRRRRVSPRRPGLSPASLDNADHSASR